MNYILEKSRLTAWVDKENLKQIGTRFVFKSYFEGVSEEVTNRLDTNDEEVINTIMQFAEKNQLRVRNTDRVLMKLDGDVYRAVNSGNDKNAVEVSSLGQLKGILSKVKKSNDLWDKIMEDLKRNIDFYIKDLKIAIYNSDIKILRGEEDVSRESLTYYIRFLGGYGAWTSMNGDICDADLLKDSVVEKLEKVVNEFNKVYREKYHIQVDWYTSEKAWTYFQFLPYVDKA